MKKLLMIMMVLAMGLMVSTARANVVPNGDFESGVLSPWYPTGDTSITHNYSVVEDTGGGNYYMHGEFSNYSILQDLSSSGLTVGDDYTMSLDIRLIDMSAGDTFSGHLVFIPSYGGALDWGKLSIISLAGLEPTGEWVHEALTFAILAGGGDLTGGRIELHAQYTNTWGAVATFDADNISLAPPLEGDANRDGVVSGGDYASVQSHFGETGVPGILGDANGNGTVSAGDFSSVQSNFGSVAATAAPGVVPEPATIALLSFGFVALARRRK